ncbi:MAG: tail fiber domain-containing protein [Candidatus Micrarchaeia archaeon]
MGNGRGTNARFSASLSVLVFCFLGLAVLPGFAGAGSVVVQNGQLNATGNFYAGAGALFVNSTSGFVGIGNRTDFSGPARPLHISAIQDAVIRLQDMSGVGPAAYIEFYNDTSRWGYVGLGGHDDKMVLGTTAEKNLSFYTNNSSKMVITVDGNVGVGTTAPAVKFDVVGVGDMLGSPTSDAKGAVIIRTSDISEDSRIALMLLRSSAQVSTTDRRISMIFGQSAWGYNPQHYFGRITGGNTVGNGGGGYLSFHAGSDGNTQVDHMTILSSGNVGIGTTSPTGLLTVVGSVYTGAVVHVKGLYPSDLADTAYINDLGALGYFGVGGSYACCSSYTNRTFITSYANAAPGLSGMSFILEGTANGAQDWRFVDGNNLAGTRVLITQAGNVGIGTVNPTEKLDVVGNLRFSNDMSVSGGTYIDWRRDYDGWNPARVAGGWVGSAFGGYISFYTNNGGGLSDLTEKVRIIQNGNVGIGTTTPSYTLTVAGTAWVTSGSWSGSDARWKKNVTALSPSTSLEKVLALKPVNFLWKTAEYPNMGFTNGTQVGFIAQDVEKVIPEVVTTDDKGYKGISYERIASVLTSAIQEQEKKIEAQQAQVDRQQAQIETLNANNEQLKALVCQDHPSVDACS